MIPVPRPKTQELRSKNTQSPPRDAVSSLGNVLVIALCAYLALATVLSVSQMGYWNADFIAYSTIASRLLAAPQTSITGYWSPLYSWCIAPLIGLGMNDLLAGRLVLVAGGILYLFAVFALVHRFHGVDPQRNRVITIAVMTVAVLQAATWSTCLLDPDLLADGLLYCYFYVLLDPLLPHRPAAALLGGAAAGLACLGKAFMFPFIMGHLPVVLLVRWWTSRRLGQDHTAGLWAWAATWARFLVMLTLFVAPWAAVLTTHYGKLTFSTAGPANHANMSPAAFGRDAMWNPGMGAGFIMDPHYGPDWSALQDFEHLVHQLKVIVYNVNNSIWHIAPWAAFAAIAAVRRGKGKRAAELPPVEHEGLPTGGSVGQGLPGLWFCVITVVMYCGGYCMINLETRYIEPAIAPLVGLGAMLVVSAPRNRDDRHGGSCPWFCSFPFRISIA